MRPPVGKHIHIPHHRHIQRRIGGFVVVFHIEPAAEGIVMSGFVDGIIHTAEHLAVGNRMNLDHAGFVSGFLKGHHVVIGSEEPHRMCDRHPFGIKCRVL